MAVPFRPIRPEGDKCVQAQGHACNSAALGLKMPFTFHTSKWLRHVMILDIVVALILLISAFIAFLRGFIREVLTIFGIVGGLVASYVGGPLLIPVMRGWMGVQEVAEGQEPQKFMDAVPYSMIADVLAYGSVLVFFVIILSVISHFISEFARAIGLGALDRTLGVVFGLARGVLVVGLLYLPFFYLMDEEAKKVNFEGSRTMVHLEAVSGWIAGYIPAEATEKLKEGAEKAKEANDARQKLQDLDILGGGNKDGKKTEPGQMPDAPPPEVEREELPPAQQKKDNGGYTDDFRKSMDDIIQENLNGADAPKKEDSSNP